MSSHTSPRSVHDFVTDEFVSHALNHGEHSHSGLSHVSADHVLPVEFPQSYAPRPVVMDPCHATPSPTMFPAGFVTPTVLQTEKKLVFPAFDGTKPVFSEWFMKVQNTICSSRYAIINILFWVVAV